MKTVIPAELVQWAKEQADAGIGREQLHQTLLGQGWSQHVAQQVLAALARAVPANSKDAPQVTAIDQAILHNNFNASRSQPGPELGGLPGWIDAGDRQLKILLSLKLPRLMLFGDLLSAQECADLITMAKPRLMRSSTVNMHEGGALTNDVRTSHGCFLKRGENTLLNRIEARIAKLLNWPVSHGENLQVLRYPPGAQYEAHFDYFDPALPGCVPLLERGGQRVGTLVIYLNTPQQGGATTFPDAGLEVYAQQGYGVFFGYDRPHPDTKSLHGGLPVIDGEKWIAVKWLREHACY